MIRKVLAIGAAFFVALLVAGPAQANTGPLDKIFVGSNPTGSYNASTDFSVTVDLGGSGTATCTNPTAPVVLYAGDPAPARYLDVPTSFTATCTGGVTPMTITLSCNARTYVDPANQTVDDNLVDTITGYLDFGTSSAPCMHLEDTFGGALCSFDVYGSTDADYDEATQKLTFSASAAHTLVITNGTGACSSLNGAQVVGSGLFVVINSPSGDLSFKP